MSITARFSRVLFVFLIANAVLVLVVSALRPVLARQEGETTTTPPVDVQLPNDDPPSLPGKASAVTTQEQLSPDIPSLPAPSPGAATSGAATSDASSSSATSSNAANGPANKMVLDEILKTIQEGRSDLDVPPLSYPPIIRPSASDANNSDMEQVSLRLKSVAEVTRSAQTLAKEAQQLKAMGKAAAARALMEHVQTLKSISVQLAAEEDSSLPQPRVSH